MVISFSKQRYMTVTCKNCNSSFKGKYCNHCGEKVVEDSDFTIRSILYRGIGAITNFDSKFYKSSKFLFFKPGYLTKNFVNGIRVPFMKPFQIFVLANIIFFFFLSELDIFRSPAKWYFYGDNIPVMDKAAIIMEQKNITLEALKSKYDSLSSDLAKGLIIIFIPFIAFFGHLSHLKSKLPFGKHLIFALHYFSFFLLICVCWTSLVELLISNTNKYIFIIPIHIFMFLHYVFGIRSFYGDSWTKAIFKGILCILFVGALIQFYRNGINILSFNLIS